MFNNKRYFLEDLGLRRARLMEDKLTSSRALTVWSFGISFTSPVTQGENHC
jgi:hypothetical protein